MSPMKQLEQLIKENHGELVRQKKHRVYRFPDHRIFVMANTPSDHRAFRNNMRTLKRFLNERTAA